MESPSPSPSSDSSSDLTSYEGLPGNLGLEADILNVENAKVRFPGKNWEDCGLGNFETEDQGQGIVFNIYAPESQKLLDTLQEKPIYVSYRPNHEVSECRSSVRSTFQSSLPNRIDLYTVKSGPKVALSLSILNPDNYDSLLNYFKNNLILNKCSRNGGGRRKPVRRTKRINKRKYKKKMTKRRKPKKQKTRRGKKGKRSSATRRR